MTAHFAKTTKKNLGYDPAEVDALVDQARSIFALGDASVADEGFIRNSQFSLVKGGYEIALVDAALDRLDDAFGLQVARSTIRRHGFDASREKLTNWRDTLLARTKRGKNKAFDSAGAFSKGYHRKQVDVALGNIAAHLEGSAKLTTAQLREVKFKPVTGGYKEAQVDAYLDRAVDFVNLEQAIGSAQTF
ncbi:MAG: DivIVA domain-containing protein [Micrococcales bacterium]